MISLGYTKNCMDTDTVAYRSVGEGVIFFRIDKYTSSGVDNCVVTEYQWRASVHTAHQGAP